MANTQDWTNFSGGCLVPGNSGHSNCAQGFIFTNFNLGLNDINPSFPGLPMITPTGNVVCTSRDNNINCYGYHIRQLQSFFCYCGGGSCATYVPSTVNSANNGFRIVRMLATINTLTSKPIFGMGISTEFSPDVDHVTGFGAIVDVVANNLNIVQWNNESLNSQATILATTPYVAALNDVINVTVQTGLISVFTNSASIGNTAFTVPFGDYAGILAVGSSSGNISDTVDLVSVGVGFGLLCP